MNIFGDNQEKKSQTVLAKEALLAGGFIVLFAYLLFKIGSTLAKKEAKAKIN